jgi:hypothetical protein
MPLPSRHFWSIKCCYRCNCCPTSIRLPTVQRPAHSGFSRWLSGRGEIAPTTTSFVNFYDPIQAKLSGLSKWLEATLICCGDLGLKVGASSGVLGLRPSKWRRGFDHHRTRGEAGSFAEFDHLASTKKQRYVWNKLSKAAPHRSSCG